MWVLTDIFSLIVEYRKKIPSGISNNIHLRDTSFYFYLMIVADQYTR